MPKRSTTKIDNSNHAPQGTFPWARLPDEKLLDVRLCDLRLRIEGTPVAERIGELYDELKARRLKLRPHCWFSHDWFAPDGVPGIAIPFFLAHPRLRKLEDEQMLDVEGGTRSSCMRLLRHEAGHAMENAYRLNRRAQWRKLFGPSTKTYPEYYRPKPFSKKYVLHLDWWYAQSHPSEDFAETFAVWLAPGSNWRKQYRGWPALKKLEYVDELMAELAGKTPPVRNKETLEPLPELTQTLREYYAEKRDRYAANSPDFYDRDLRRTFPANADAVGARSAVALLRRAAPELSRKVAVITGQHSYTINVMLREMITRCRELNLHATRAVEDIKLDVAILLTMQITNFLQSGAQRLAL
ncbi:MAG: putative zinc-binding metallopeptidase [Phycisphaerales bacterium]|nr:putative zinc-binding metallopeptidase [Phycisphaerales bacterium]